MSHMTDPVKARELMVQGMKETKASVLSNQLLSAPGRKKLIHYSISNFKNNPQKFNYSIFVQFIEYMQSFHMDELMSWEEIREFGQGSLENLINYMIVCDVIFS